jgi:hypothetical protein
MNALKFYDRDYPVYFLGKRIWPKSPKPKPVYTNPTYVPPKKEKS